MPEDDDVILFVNHDAMYWRSRALEAEAECAELRQQLHESVDTGVRLAQTSSDNLLHAIMGGAFDRKEPG